MLFRSNDTATTEIYTPVNTLSLHDALPIYAALTNGDGARRPCHLGQPVAVGPALALRVCASMPMITAAAQAVAGLTDATTPGAPLLPPIDDVRTTSAQVALAVAQAAADDSVAGLPGITADAVRAAMWQPRYAPVHAV